MPGLLLPWVLPPANGLLPPPYLIQPHWVLEAAQGHIAPVSEQETLALDKLPDDVGDEYLAP